MRLDAISAAGMAVMLGLAAHAGTLGGDTEAAEVRTSKERLSDKASDEQRLDNCGVPPERRGPVPRPGCPAEGTDSKTGTARSTPLGPAASSVR